MQTGKIDLLYLLWGCAQPEVMSLPQLLLQQSGSMIFCVTQYFCDLLLGDCKSHGDK